MDYHNLALFSDLDGTLLDSQRQVSRENRQALEHFIAGGGLFGISTGRAPLNALALLPGVPINTWSVVLNGAEAYRYQTGTVAFPRVLPQLRAAALVQWVLERLPRTQVLLCSESRLFFLSPRDLADPDFLLSHQPCTFTNLGAALDYPWLKILFAAPRPDLEHLEQWATDYGILEVMDRVYTSPTYLEFLPRGVHKGRCLRDLRCLDVLKNRRMIAVGDYTNDLELLREADVSIAVANALPEVQAAAAYHTLSNKQSAFAHIIREILPDFRAGGHRKRALPLSSALEAAGRTLLESPGVFRSDLQKVQEN